jgi:RNA polymerase sigma-70 factor (ECF subfamily)
MVINGMGERLDVLRLFDEHHALLFRFAYRLTGSAADAEDIVQACFVEVLKPDCSYDPDRAPIQAWLLGIARNQSRKRLQQKTRPDPRKPDEQTSPEEQTFRAEIENVVRHAVLQLPESQREVLILAHYEQLPLGEIAGILDIDLGAVKSRLQRARAGLRAMLTEYAPKAERKQ